MRARTERFVSSDGVPKGTLVSDTAASRGSRTMRRIVAPGQVSTMSSGTSRCRGVFSTQRGFPLRLARCSVSDSSIEASDGGRAASQARTSSRLRPNIGWMGCPPSERLVTKAVARRGQSAGSRMRARSRRPRRDQRERQCVSGPQSKEGCAASMAESSVVPDRGPPTTKTGCGLERVTGPTLARRAVRHAIVPSVRARPVTDRGWATI